MSEITHPACIDKSLGVRLKHPKIIRQLPLHWSRAKWRKVKDQASSRRFREESEAEKELGIVWQKILGVLVFWLVTKANLMITMKPRLNTSDPR